MPERSKTLFTACAFSTKLINSDTDSSAVLLPSIPSKPEGCTVISAGWDLLGEIFDSAKPSLCIEVVVESQNWVGMDLQKSSNPPLLPWVRTSCSGLSCSKAHPAWPWTFPMIGYPKLPWAACVSFNLLSEAFLVNTGSKAQSKAPTSRWGTTPLLIWVRDPNPWVLDHRQSA